MFLDLDGEGPLYRQLTRALKAAVLDGRIGAGARLPATRELALELNLSRNTVRVAYEQLMAEGFFQGKVGSGSYVAQTPVAALPQKPSKLVGPQSRYAQRLRSIQDVFMGRLHRGLRFNLQYGEPIHDLTAISAWRRELSYAALHTSPNYPMTQGVPALREAVCDYLLRRRGMSCAPEDVLIVSGTQQAMALTAQVLIDAGDKVGIEDPHYFSARHVLHAYGARLVLLPTDEDGLVCKDLAKHKPKLVFVSPAHQFPGGSLMSMPRRIELLRYADKNKAWIFEDDYDSEFRYGSQPMPALSALDGAGRVIYAGSFSKVMFPSLRLGYMVMPPALRDDFVRAKRLSDLGSPAIEQVAMARYVSSGRFERHLRRVVQIARSRRKALLDGLERVGQGHFSVQDSRAGMHLVAWLPYMNHAQCDRLIVYASERGLGLHPIAPHYKKPPRTPGLLLGYAALSVTEIEAAMRVLKECIKEVVGSPKR
jgi:GntR family transcriptional regulator / MocR family aminotransferase